MRRLLVPCLIVVASLLASQQAWSQQSSTSAKAEETMGKSAAATYEHLASAIIAIEATENELVKSILLGYHAAAQGHLKAAIADEKGRHSHLEAAANEIVSIANEGDKRIQAVRQRLKQAGHTHHTDAETKEDYLFVNSKEKKNFLALAKRVGQLDASAKPTEISGVAEELTSQFDKAVASE